MDICDQLLTLARKKQWDQFEPLLIQREKLIAELMQDVDLDNPVESFRTEIKKLQKKNQELVDLCSVEQQGLVEALSALKQGAKAKSTYQKIK